MKRPTLAAAPEGTVVLCCISSPFGGLSTTEGKIAYVLLTRAPLYRGRSPFSLDLHVLSAPLTFVLSQDQTLQFESFGNPAGLAHGAPYCSLMRTRRLRGTEPGGAKTHAISRVQSDSVFKDRGKKFLPFRGRGI